MQQIATTQTTTAGLALVTTDGPAAPAPATGAPQRPMLLVVSQERFGRAMAVRRLRSNGFYTVLADDAAQAVRRLSSVHQPIDGVVVVGTLSDATADSLRRWMREHGHPDLAMVAIGTELEADDPWAHEVAIEDWDVDGPLGEPTRTLLSARYAPGAALAA
ncbi:MAG: hypothetical protein REI11_18265 [Patulibacter sp.]|nr:hypothetical protein [Patulibacter sp.]